MWYVVGLYQSRASRTGSALGLDSVFVLRAGPMRSYERALAAELTVMRGKWLSIHNRKYKVEETYVVEQHELGKFGLFPRGRDLTQYLLPGAEWK